MTTPALAPTTAIQGSTVPKANVSTWVAVKRTGIVVILRICIPLLNALDRLNATLKNNAVESVAPAVGMELLVSIAPLQPALSLNHFAAAISLLVRMTTAVDATPSCSMIWGIMSFV